jgi:transcriptional regulator with XRE-family HTH domain
MNINQIVGKHIKMIRKLKGMTQAELAEKVGLNRSSIANIEIGNQAILLQNLEVIRMALDCSMYDLIPVEKDDKPKFDISSDINPRQNVNNNIRSIEKIMSQCTKLLKEFEKEIKSNDES